MGNSTGLLIFWGVVSMVALVFTFSIASIDPCNESLLANAPFTGGNVLSSNLDGEGSYTCSDGIQHYSSYNFNNNLGDQIGSNVTRGTTGGFSLSNTIQNIFPDWLYSSYSWLITVGRFVVNIIGAPYTFAMSFFPNSSISAIVGALFSVINLFVIINYIRGTDT